MLLCFVDFLRTGISSAQRGFGLRLASQFPRIAQCLQRHPLQPFPLFAHSSELGLANLVKVCGETGIRTPETLLEFTRFPGVPLQPLEHLFQACLFNHSSISPSRKSATYQNRLQNYYKKSIYARNNVFFFTFALFFYKKNAIDSCVYQKKAVSLHRFSCALAGTPLIHAPKH